MEFVSMSILMLLFLAAIIGIGVWVSYEESLAWAAITWTTAISVMHFAFGISIFSTLGVLGALGLLFGYVCLGGLYTGLVLWPRWLRKRKNSIKEAYEKWNREPEDKRSDFYESLRYAEFTASNNKQRLATWTLMWVPSLVWDATHKPIIWVYENAYRSFGRLFDLVGKRTTSKILEE